MENSTDSPKIDEENDSVSVQSDSSTASLTKQTKTTTTMKHKQNHHHSGSILFQPHRTVGLITTSRPYSLTSGSTSHLDTFLTVPLHERFIIYKCDALQPVMVSEALCTSKSNLSTATDSRGEKMFYAISDNSLSITVALHGYKGRWNASHATLYQRAKGIQQISIVGKKKHEQDWGIVHVQSLGRNKFDIHDNGKLENCLMMVMVLAKNDLGDDEHDVIGDHHDDDNHEATVSNEDHSDEDSSTTTSTSSSSSDSDQTDATESKGEIVIVLASRNRIMIQKRIPLDMIPDFTPTVVMHPHTYLNKIVIGSQDGRLVLLNIRSGKLIHEFKCISSNTFFGSKITVLEQSPAVDTIAVGTEGGKVHLINLRADVKLFTLDHNGSEISALSFRTDALALEHNIAPMAVGQKNGSISIWDLTPRANDEIDDYKKVSIQNGQRTLLCKMEKVHPGGVAALNYLPQEPLLLSSGIKSNRLIMHIFDNPNHSGRILRQRVGHTAPPSLIRYQFSSNGGILASMADGTDAASCQILSCGGYGDNSLRVFSTARSVLDREYSQGKGLEKKARELGLVNGKADLLLKEIIGMANCEAKSRDWGDLVTIHKDHAIAYVWSTKTKSQSGPILRQDNWNISAMQVQPPKSCHATSVAISSCGNFAVVGTKGGVIYKYNVQSGMPRGSFPRDATDDNNKTGKNAKLAGNINRTTKMLERTLKVHKLTNEEVDETVLRNKERIQQRLQLARHVDASVVGLAVDTLNRTLVSVGSDSKLIMWSFATHAPHKSSPIKLSSPATKLVHAKDSDLLAVVLEDFSVFLFDFATLNIVRRFGIAGSKACHTAPISDVAFGPDGRKLFTSSFDGTLRVWDVPTNTCVDWMSFVSPPTSLSLSTTGEFLATSHQERLGISLWCDRSFFQTVHLDGANPPTTPFFMDEPASVAEEEDHVSLTHRAIKDKKSSKFSQNDKSLDIVEDEQGLVVPKREGLITLSGLPAAHWKNLFHLELVKERNKPSEAPKKPPSAPFFLQWRGDESTGLHESSGDINAIDGSQNTDDEWNATWNDDDDDIERKDQNEDDFHDNYERRRKRSISQSVPISRIHVADGKRTKVRHFRSDLASLLERCSESDDFKDVTEFLATMGPSSVDVAFSTLCNGMHDLEEGLEYLFLCAKWLLQASKSRQSFEAVNAYMHRFLYIHANTIAGVDTSTFDRSLGDSEEALNQMDTKEKFLMVLQELKISQKLASETLRCKMQETLCLLRHFSRMV
jgi:U3 small nucleolar RNA-associated protein 21